MLGKHRSMVGKHQIHGWMPPVHCWNVECTDPWSEGTNPWLESASFIPVCFVCGGAEADRFIYLPVGDKSVSVKTFQDFDIGLRIMPYTRLLFSLNIH